nr:putative tripartite motif-containing protein 61 isoform X1 [Helicoverpa armigera]
MRDSKCDLPKRRVKSEFESATSLDVKASSILSSCRICLSSMLDPAALTCGHRFCEKCLNHYWRIREKPDYIVCPLCRNCAFNVDFAKKEEATSTDDFRKMFGAMEMNDSELNSSLVLCLKLSLLVPALYCLVKWLKIPVLGLLTAVQSKLTSKM